MLILDMQMPRACDDCPMLDESGDYPMCRITHETRGYTFNTREKRMDRCPIKGELTRCGECKFAELYTGKFSCSKNWNYITADWYCADGERR